jgi:hypothetical protein
MSYYNACQLVSVDEVLAYMGIDYSDEMVVKNIERAIRTADAYLRGSIAYHYQREDPRAKELALIIISDLYDNRGLQSTISGNTRKLVDDLCLQLRLEERRYGCLNYTIDQSQSKESTS